MEIIVITLIVCTVSLLLFLVRITYNVTQYDPLFALKAFASGLGSSLFGYLVHGYVVIKIVLWGVGGFVAYVAYCYFSEEQ
jgi:hypothetical protein